MIIVGSSDGNVKATATALNHGEHGGKTRLRSLQACSLFPNAFELGIILATSTALELWRTPLLRALRVLHVLGGQGSTGSKLGFRREIGRIPFSTRQRWVRLAFTCETCEAAEPQTPARVRRTRGERELRARVGTVVLGEETVRGCASGGEPRRLRRDREDVRVAGREADRY